MSRWGIAAVALNAGIVLGALGIICYDILGLLMNRGD